MIHRPDKLTFAVGALGVLVLFVPIPLVTQFVGIPLLVYACYRYWGRDDLGSESWGVRERADGLASRVGRRDGSGLGSDRTTDLGGDRTADVGADGSDTTVESDDGGDGSVGR
ncbi:hypothetical protein ACFO0N_19000 [Halobium salinum]|uniref:Uncharacterized protein n=1 Tax=Halobium salinum TaxID=1364940 RepID=A0ABD5PH71_9EURY|nr:hypothetical protein [Halobium salinum]